MAKGSGISYSTVCSTDRLTYCTAWTPIDEEEGIQAMCTRGLKMSARIGESRLRAEVVTSKWKWFYLRFKYRKKPKLCR
jgi:hypothetical protein